MSQIGDLIAELANTGVNLRAYSMPAKVESVNLSDKTATVIVTETDEEIEVNLTALKGSSNGMLIEPVQGSDVLISFTNKSNAHISAYTDVNSYILATANEDLKSLMLDLISAIKNRQQTVPVPGGSSTTVIPAINEAEFIAIETRINQFFG